jgi:hypothetical protein
MSESLTGRCLCGEVSYEAKAAPVLSAHCQCIDCRKASGTGHCTHVAVPRSAFEVGGEIKFYDSPADSGNIVGRGFCPNCGCPVYSVNSGMPDLVSIRASSLDDPEAITPQLVVYASRGPSWDKVDSELTAFPTMPPEMPV